jgi:hypothetical protein
MPSIKSFFGQWQSSEATLRDFSPPQLSLSIQQGYAIHNDKKSGESAPLVSTVETSLKYIQVLLTE